MRKLGRPKISPLAIIRGELRRMEESIAAKDIGKSEAMFRLYAVNGFIKAFANLQNGQANHAVIVPK